MAEYVQSARAKLAIAFQGVQIFGNLNQFLNEVFEAGIVRRGLGNGLGELRRWLDQFWDDALEAFKKEVEKPKNPGGGKKP